MNITKFMQKLNKPFEPITTLIIIYFALLAVSIALYALIQIFFKADTATASSVLSWSATMFATIALLFTFYNWRKQKESEVIASEAKSILYDINIYNTLIGKMTSYLSCVIKDNDSIEEIKKIYNQVNDLDRVLMRKLNLLMDIKEDTNLRNLIIEFQVSTYNLIELFQTANEPVYAIDSDSLTHFFQVYSDKYFKLKKLLISIALYK